VATNLDGSTKASNALAAEAIRLLGGHIDVLVNNAELVDVAEIEVICRSPLVKLKIR